MTQSSQTGAPARILVFGSTGQVATELRRQARFLSRAEADLAALPPVRRPLRPAMPPW